MIKIPSRSESAGLLHVRLIVEVVLDPAAEVTSPGATVSARSKSMFGVTVAVVTVISVPSSHGITLS